MHPDPEPDTQSEEGGPPILILDPDSRIAEALALALRRRTQVERVTSGMAALLVAGEREVGLVLARGHLPDIPPDDFLRLLRLLRPGVRVALLGTEAPSEGFLEAKPDVYFPEPIQLKYLLAWIADCLDQPSSSAPGVASPPVQYEIPPSASRDRPLGARIHRALLPGGDPSLEDRRVGRRQPIAPLPALQTGHRPLAEAVSDAASPPGRQGIDPGTRGNDRSGGAPGRIPRCRPLRPRVQAVGGTDSFGLPAADNPPSISKRSGGHEH